VGLLADRDGLLSQVMELLGVDPVHRSDGFVYTWATLDLVKQRIEELRGQAVAATVPLPWRAAMAEETKRYELPGGWAIEQSSAFVQTVSPATVGTWGVTKPNGETHVEGLTLGDVIAALHATYDRMASVGVQGSEAVQRLRSRLGLGRLVWEERDGKWFASWGGEYVGADFCVEPDAKAPGKLVAYHERRGSITPIGCSALADVCQAACERWLDAQLKEAGVK